MIASEWYQTFEELTSISNSCLTKEKKLQGKESYKFILWDKCSPNTEARKVPPKKQTNKKLTSYKKKNPQANNMFM